VTFTAIVVKNLLNRPTRSLLTIAGLALGVAGPIALASTAWGFESTRISMYSVRGTDLIVTRAESLSPVAISFSHDEVRDIGNLPEVGEASGMLNDVMSLEDMPVMMLMGLESNTFIWDHLRLVSGRRPANDDEPVLMLGTIAAEVLKKVTGSEIKIGRRTFTVCGTFESASLAENGSVVMTLPQLQRVTHQEGRVNFLNLKLAEGMTAAHRDNLRASIVAGWPGFKAFSAGQMVEQTAAIRAVKAMSQTTTAIAILIGALSVMNTMMMSIAERTREIGLLLAVGWRRRRIIRLILSEALTLSMAGGTAGLAGGIALVKFFEQGPFLQGKIAPEIGSPLFALAFGIAIGLGVAGGAYPAVRAARLSPCEALRHE
jgi:putative ABC transport system permease protein